FDMSKLDWKRFLGSAADRPFDADQFGNWRWYWDFGGGAMTDLFVHWVDVAHWIMNDDTPTRATATGLKAVLVQRQTPDTMSAALAYGKVVVEFDSALLGYIEGGGLMIRGTKAAMRPRRAPGTWPTLPCAAAACGWGDSVISAANRTVTTRQLHKAQRMRCALCRRHATMQPGGCVNERSYRETH